MTKRLLGKTELEDIVWGSTLLGAGGGGSPHNGLSLVKEMKNEVTLLDPADLPETANTVAVAGTGAPTAFSEKGLGPEAMFAYDAIKNVAAVGGINLDYLIPIEIGGFNTIVPFYVASQRNLPVVDADGCGRAVPEFKTTLYSVYKLPASPIVLANKAGDVLVLYLADPLDMAAAEAVDRAVCVPWGMLGGLAVWIVNIATVKRCLVLNSISKVEKIGKAIREARASGKDAVKEVVTITGGKELLRGKIEKIETRAAEGFDFGRTTIKGTTDYEGKTLIIDFKNENILAWQDEKPVVMVPDLVTVMTTKGEPLTNVDTKEGMEVAVIGIPAPEPWGRTPDGFSCWKHILVKLGYGGSYISYQSLL